MVRITLVKEPEFYIVSWKIGKKKQAMVLRNLDQAMSFINNLIN